MEHDLRNRLARLCGLFCEATGLQMTTLSQRAAGDWRWLGRVLGGGNFSIRKHDEIVAWLNANWPEGAAWPSDIPRPVAPAPVEETAA